MATGRSRRRRSVRRQTRRTHRGGAFNWKSPWHSLKKSVYKRVWKSRYNKMHANKLQKQALVEDMKRKLQGSLRPDAFPATASRRRSVRRKRPARKSAIMYPLR